MTNELALRERNTGNVTMLPASRPHFNFEEMVKIGKVLAASGFFSDSRQEAQAITKVLAGAEMGFEAFQSMTGIHIIQGKPSVSANLMAARIKASAKYDYRVARLDDDVCELIFFENGEEVGRSDFTRQDAMKAKTQNLDKFPRNMLFARAMSNGIRWYAPDVFMSPVYTPDELGASVDREGNVLEMPATVTSEVSTPPLVAETPVESASPVQAAPTVATTKELNKYDKLRREANEKGALQVNGQEWPALASNATAGVVLKGIERVAAALEAKKQADQALHSQVHENYVGATAPVADDSSPFAEDANAVEGAANAIQEHTLTIIREWTNKVPNFDGVLNDPLLIETYNTWDKNTNKKPAAIESIDEVPNSKATLFAAALVNGQVEIKQPEPASVEA